MNLDMIILGIDPGLFFGWCTMRDGEYVKSGEVKDTPRKGSDFELGNRYWFLGEELVCGIEGDPGNPPIFTFDAIAIEHPMPRGPKSSRASLISMGAHFGALAAAYPCDQLYTPAPATWMRGRRVATLKRDAAAIAGRKVGEHERDAILIAAWCWGQEKLRLVKEGGR